MTGLLAAAIFGAALMGSPDGTDLAGVDAPLLRTERDSNSRYAFTYTRFPGVRLKPLGHPSRHRFIPATREKEPDNAQVLNAAITDRERFELSIPLPVRRFSRPVPSTTRPPVQRERKLNAVSTSTIRETTT